MTMGVSYHNMSVGVKLAIDGPLSDNSPSALFFLCLLSPWQVCTEYFILPIMGNYIVKSLMKSTLFFLLTSSNNKKLSSQCVKLYSISQHISIVIM